MPVPAAERTVHVEPIDVSFRLGEGETLIQAAWREGYYWPTVCGGRGECTACHVFVRGGAEHTMPAGDYENAMIRPLTEGTAAGCPVRLACQLKVTGPVTVYKRAVRKRLA
jgi:ferredoxin, 2Fe-2S